MSAKRSVLFREVLAGFSERPVIALSLTQTLGYGSLFYAFGILAGPIARDFGIGLDVFFGLFSCGLLIGGLAAPLAGRWLDRFGAHRLMTIGSLVAACALCLIALSPNVWFFGASLILLECAACLVLYEAAFAGLTQIYRFEARQRITAITLVAGFASTIFWPLTLWLEVRFGWRGAFLVYAAANLLLGTALHWLFLKDAKPVDAASPLTRDDTPEPPMLEGPARDRAFILYATAICVSGIAYSAVPIHMIKIIEGQGFSASHAAMIAMVMGPAQIIARIIEVTYGQRFDALMTGRVALSALCACFLLLILASGSPLAAFAFAALYGVSQGLITIARGTVPLQLFGVRGYATIVGKVTGLRFLVNAFGPFVFALIATQFGVLSAIGALGVAGAIALLAFVGLRKPVAKIEPTR